MGGKGRLEAGSGAVDSVITDHLQGARFIDAIVAATRQLDLRLERFGRGSAAAARSYRTLASIYHQCGIYGRAEELARLALAVDRRRLQPDDTEIARTLTLLGKILKDAVRLDEARAAYEEALEILSRTMSPGDLEFAPVLANLGYLERREGRGDEAEQHLRAALAIRRRHLGPHCREVAEQQAWLAWLLNKRGKSA